MAPPPLKTSPQDLSLAISFAATGVPKRTPFETEGASQPSDLETTEGMWPVLVHPGWRGHLLSTPRSQSRRPVGPFSESPGPQEQCPPARRKRGLIPLPRAHY